ncbi:MAG TPA: hypothetical protein VF794_40065 [Archangium sp.]|uniref:hypothetical protein n=1 Tax=Archangium sp. TaxID=1872627 RepID=UPI002ED90942
MKYYCEACERIVPPAAFRIEDDQLVLKCSRCKVETRGGSEGDGEPVPAAASKPKPKSADAPVIMLAGEEAERDPIENEPTRRIAVPEAVLAAIEAEAQESRKKKEPAAPEPVAVKISAAQPEVMKFEAPERTKTPAPMPVVAKAPAPEPAPSRPSSPKMVMSEAAAANLVVLRTSEVKARLAAESTPAPMMRTADRPSSAQLRVVEAPAPTPAPIPTASAASGEAEDPFSPPPGYCPKCIGVRRDGAVVCPYCGLEYARFRAEEFRPSTALHSTWLGVLELWESKGAHDKVLSLASERGELATLGRLYRIRQARFPDDAVAKRGREEVLRLASAGSGLLQPSEKPDKRTKIKTAMLGVVFFILTIIAVAIAMKAREMLLRP